MAERNADRGTDPGPDPNADRDYGFSGRELEEGNYSGAYGRGTAGETNAPSAGGALGAGYAAGGADIPAPDREDGPVDEGREDRADAAPGDGPGA